MNEMLAQRLKDRYRLLEKIRRPWLSLWAEAASYMMPRRAHGMGTIGDAQTPTNDLESRLFDSTAVRANMTLASGQLSWMSPMESKWFSFEPRGKAEDAAKMWLAEASNEAAEAMAQSNFYAAIHEFYLDRGALGTAAMYIESGRRDVLNCQFLPCGTYVIDADEEGNIDTLIREMEFTPRQAVAKFGEDAVHPKILKDLEKHGDKKTCFLHFIYPRADADRDKVKQDGENMPIASVYLDLTNSHICRISGYEEQPFVVSQYLRWGTAYGNLYGWSPAFAALPDVRQVNFLQKMMDALAEKMAFPPVLAASGLEGEIDANAFGVTYISPELGSINEAAREWMTGGRYDIGLQRVQERQNSINEAFHVDLFKMFASLEKQMTATEIAERAQEKLIQFSPTFALMTTQVFNPLLERIFNLLFRLERFDAAPENMGEYKVSYHSRVALAIKALFAIGYGRSLGRLQAVAEMYPAVLDNYDFDAAERESAITDGVPPEFLRRETDRDQMRADRAEAQQAAQEAEQAAMVADSAAKLGKVPGDSSIGKKITEGVNQL